MTRQRQESAKTYEEAGRLDLSERELSEIQVIEYFCLGNLIVKRLR